jgi:hypothetical protein
VLDARGRVALYDNHVMEVTSPDGVSLPGIFSKFEWITGRKLSAIVRYKHGFWSGLVRPISAKNRQRKSFVNTTFGIYRS